MKIKSKIKPLILAISFTMIGMGTGQILLYRETTDSVISHCREINRQNISFYNLITSKAIIPSDGVEEKTQKPKYCLRFLSKNTKSYLEDLKLYKTNDLYEALSISSEKIRLYADNYQSLENKRAKTTKSLLMMILVMNVLGLASMSIFLRQDSEEM